MNWGDRDPPNYIPLGWSMREQTERNAYVDQKTIDRIHNLYQRLREEHRAKPNIVYARVSARELGEYLDLCNTLWIGYVNLLDLKTNEDTP